MFLTCLRAFSVYSPSPVCIVYIVRLFPVSSVCHVALYIADCFHITCPLYRLLITSPVYTLRGVGRVWRVTFASSERVAKQPCNEQPDVQGAVNPASLPEGRRPALADEFCVPKSHRKCVPTEGRPHRRRRRSPIYRRLRYYRPSIIIFLRWCRYETVVYFKMGSAHEMRRKQSSTTGASKKNPPPSPTRFMRRQAAADSSQVLPE